MTAGHLVYVRNMRGSFDPEKRPDDMPHNRPANGRVDACHALTAEELDLPLAVLEKRYPPPKIGAQD
jgi:hypothetical protein